MLFVIGSTPLAFDNMTVSHEYTEVQSNEHELAYTTHDAIRIFNNTDFMWQAGNESWAGDGSEETPYIIQGYNITEDATASIEIRDVTVYFEIRDCYVRATNPNIGGVVLYNVTHGHLEDCIIMDKNTGLELDYCDGLSIVNCTMDNNADGITLEYCNDTTITSSYLINTRTGSGYYQDNSHRTTITGSYFTDNGDYGLETYYSDHFTFTDCEVSGNDYAGFLIENSHHGLYQDNLVFDNLDEGFVVSSSDYVSIIGNDVYDNDRYGVYFSDTQYGFISQNTLNNNTLDGIRIDVGDHCIVELNQVFDNGWTNFGAGATADGILVGTVVNCSVTGNTVYNNSMHGIEVDSAVNSVIQDNTVYSNFGVQGECGIYVSTADFSNFTANVVYNNTENGMYIQYADDCLVTYNVAYENAVNGIYLFNCNRTLLYYNDFAWNPTNAYDQSGSTRENYWNSTMVGNWYSDYNGTETYNITGSAESVDWHPSVSLWGGTASDVEYELGSTGNEVVLEASALNPGNFELYINDELVDTITWNGEDVEANVDGLDVGIHNISITAFHISGHSVSGKAQVTVVDTTPPDWVTQPEDQYWNIAETLSYQVSATDLSGIGSWSLNDTRFAIDDGLITNTTTLPLGSYGLRIGVNDTYDNERSFDIRILVLPEPTVPTTSSTTVTTIDTTTSTTTITTTTTPPPTDPTMILIIAGAGGVAVIVIIVLVMKRKSS